MTIDSRRCQDRERALSLEWLETIGRGGYASGTVAGANTRRYHALLLVARHPPVDRVVLVNHVEESVESGGRIVPLSTNVYSGAVHPEGYQYCEEFSAEPWPTWRYAGQGIRLTRELLCPQGRDMVILRWRLLDDRSSEVVLRVRPMLTGRDFHAIHRENPGVQGEATTKEGHVTWHPYEGLPAVRAFHNGHYHHGPDWYRQVHYRVERERGLDQVFEKEFAALNERLSASPHRSAEYFFQQYHLHVERWEVFRRSNHGASDALRLAGAARDARSEYLR